MKNSPKRRLSKETAGMKSNFIRLFGDTPTNRLWEFLINSRGLFDYSMTDVCEATGIAWNTLGGIFPSFVKEGIVKKTRAIGRATMYMLNESHPKAVFMTGVYNAVSMVFVHGGRFRLEVKIKGAAKHPQPRPITLDIDKKAVEPLAIFR